MREPIFGPNAKPFAKQFAVGLAIFFVASWFVTTDWFYQNIDLPLQAFISQVFAFFG